MTVLAIDPGNEQSAYVIYEDGRPIEVGKVANAELLKRVGSSEWRKIEHAAIEMIASYGMPVGAEVFETCLWIGRYIQSWSPRPWSLMYRRDVKLHLCGQARAKDGNIRQALIDRYGGKEKAIGNKAKPGPLYGFKADLWQALAVAVTYSDRQSLSCVSGQSDAKHTVAGPATIGVKQ